MATRSQVREVVVQLLYAYGSGNDGISKFMDTILEEHKIKNAQGDFARTLFYGVLEAINVVDLRIKHQLKGWDFTRLGEIERAILRLGVYEIVFNQTDKAIAINEALELAKNFGNEPSVKFINGVLDGIAKERETSIEMIQANLEAQAQMHQEITKEKGVESNASKIKTDAKKKSKRIFKKDNVNFKQPKKHKKSVVVTMQQKKEQEQ